MNRRTWLVSLLVISLLLTACGMGKVRAPQATVTAPQVAETPVVVPMSAPGNVILMDGELKSVTPLLKLAFPAGAAGELLTVQVRVGQSVKQGDLIATVDDTELRRAVEDAKRALNRAIEDKAKGEADAERKYQRALQDAEDKYQREVDSAQKKYERELRDARRAVEKAQRDLQRAKMQPPTTAVSEAEANLAKALDQERQAADNYKQSLDRPWEPQRIRDSYYKEWQARIKERELAQLRLQDARVSLDVYVLDLKAKEQAVLDARTDLDSVSRDSVKKDIAEREVSLAWDRAVDDARRKLADAQEKVADARLLAPKDGLVYTVDAAVGATVSGGTPIATLLDAQALYFVTQNLAERHVAQVHPGQRANVTLRTYPETVLTGRVEMLLPQLERKTDNDARFAAHIRLDETALTLLPGMTGRVEIVLRE